MTIFTITFLLGDLFLQQQAQLPNNYVLILTTITLALIAIQLLTSTSSKPKHYLLIITAGLLAGFAYTSHIKQELLNWELPKTWEEKPLSARGTIQSLPTPNPFGQHFIFQVTQLSNNERVINRKAFIRLSWNTNKILHAGDEYQLTVKLKRIHGVINPGSFDYAAWALQNGLRATGSVVTKAPQTLITHHYDVAPLNQIRQHLKNTLTKLLPHSETSPWLLALMLGERDESPSSQWEVLRATGTNHLMAIAGLHIGLASGFVYAIICWLWRRSEFLLRIYPAQMAASWSSLITAWCYSALAGFSLPTQRACIMLTVFITARLLRRTLPAWHAWSLAMLMVMLQNPLSILSSSFWLSFITIALIIYGMQGRIAPQGVWWHWGRVQAVISLGLIPISLWFYQQTSLISLLANSVAIPWLGFFILPFCLLALLFLTVLPAVSHLLLICADISLQWLWKLLSWFSNFHFAVLTAPINTLPMLVITMIGCLILLLPRGTPGKWFGIFFMLPIILIHAPVPNDRHFWLTVLDVGQGLSVVVQTKHHQLVYDTGAKFGDGLDMGESVLVPYLHYAGIKNIDMLVISHGDNDHAGGANALIKQIDVKQVLTSVPEKLIALNALPCVAGTHWNWDNVEFTFLYPYLNSPATGNDKSCVLKISDGKQSVLLTGDIEKFAENKLLENDAGNLSANILIAPHHGSKTSSQLAFIRAVAPQYVIYSTGYHNRYHFPHNTVIERYSTENILQLNTVDNGAIQFKL